MMKRLNDAIWQIMVVLIVLPLAGAVAWFLEPARAFMVNTALPALGEIPLTNLSIAALSHVMLGGSPLEAFQTMLTSVFQDALVEVIVLVLCAVVIKELLALPSVSAKKKEKTPPRLSAKPLLGVTLGVVAGMAALLALASLPVAEKQRVLLMASGGGVAALIVALMIRYGLGAGSLIRSLLRLAVVIVLTAISSLLLLMALLLLTQMAAVYQPGMKLTLIATTYGVLVGLTVVLELLTPT